MKKYIVFYEFYLDAEDIFQAEREALLYAENLQQGRLIDKKIEVTVRET